MRLLPSADLFQNLLFYKIISGVLSAHRIGGNQNISIIDYIDKKIVRNRVFHCHLSPDWRQMAMENTVSNNFDPHSSIVKSLFDCCLSRVIKESNGLDPDQD